MYWLVPLSSVFFIFISSFAIPCIAIVMIDSFFWIQEILV